LASQIRFFEGPMVIIPKFQNKVRNCPRWWFPLPKPTIDAYATTS
jgi:hypothetical protein